MKQFLKPLRTIDISTIIFLTFLSIINVIFCAQVSDCYFLVVINSLSSIAIIFYCGYAEDKTGVLRWVRDFYMVAGIPLLFKEMYLLVHPIHPYDYDQLLIQIDHWLFGVHPTQWLYQFSHPIITEILQLAYSSFYFLMVILGIELYQRKNKDAFQFSIFAIVYGFLLSYIGYLLVPAVGPRFTLHEFSNIDTDLPGLFITSTLRMLLNLGESIPNGIPNPLALVQRDVFPSGHTQMTLTVIYLAYKFRVRTRWFLWISGTLLIIATVYLQYHYVIDLIGGAVFMVFTIWSAPILEKKWKSYVSKN